MKFALLQRFSSNRFVVWKRSFFKSAFFITLVRYCRQFTVCIVCCSEWRKLHLHQAKFLLRIQ